MFHKPRIITSFSIYCANKNAIQYQNKKGHAMQTKWGQATEDHNKQNMEKQS